MTSWPSLEAGQKSNHFLFLFFSVRVVPVRGRSFGYRGFRLHTHLQGISEIRSHMYLYPLVFSVPGVYHRIIRWNIVCHSD